jgi:hypothetical protein
MSELGAGHVRQKPLESGLQPGYVWFFWKLWFLDRDFNYLHFTNSPNASSLIVQSS